VVFTKFLTIILRSFPRLWCLNFTRLTLKDIFTLAIRHPNPNIDLTKFVRSFFNITPDWLFPYSQHYIFFVTYESDQ